MLKEEQAMERQSFGNLNVFLFEGEEGKPVKESKVIIRDMNGNTLSTQYTNTSGQIDKVKLPAPPKIYSIDPTYEITPYSKYTVEVDAPGYQKLKFNGVQVFDGIDSVQKVQLELLRNIDERQPVQEFNISDNTLLGYDEPKNLEDPLQHTITMPEGSHPYIATIIPEYLDVHLGPPNKSAPKLKVKFKDYIKNVACCEIYSTWHPEAIKAIITAIISFTLNRISTEFYKPKGFHITSYTGTDHKFNKAQTIFSSIEQIVDEYFNHYISYPGMLSPYLAQYSDGKKVKRPNWLSQWGAQSLAQSGKNHIEILKTYYGDKITISSTSIIKGYPPESYPGFELKERMTDKSIKTLKGYLNVISKNYPAMPKLNEDEVFDSETTRTVKVFQRIFHLSQNGIVDFKTWYRINDVYVSVLKLAEGREKRKNYTPKDDYSTDYIPVISWVPMWVPIVQYWKKRI
ncbi:peptidoglycan-binding protein [Priestia megaterium]|uniref:peptidoglycan-binding protein n=1 Tax=Priestia megaterium TaxID=1404 RepID=UPI0013269EF3|nr:peptidoglycan-binding protein [Priestia megaterium]MUL33952.1 putative peptidoglycan binding domain protein [Priestia megaterium]